MAFLGHVIFEEGVSVELNKIESIIKWPKPNNAYEIMRFLGFAGYY
jgi:hypothetical protein